VLLTKIRNGVELTWDSLDQQERQVVLYFVVYTLVTLFAAAARASRERLKRELREELHSGAASS
jgi:hypothetical protein